MSEPTAYYWQEKARVCERAFLQQIQEGNEGEAIRNLFRMTYALNMKDLQQEKETEK